MTHIQTEGRIPNACCAIKRSAWIASIFSEATSVLSSKEKENKVDLHQSQSLGSTRVAQDMLFQTTDESKVQVNIKRKPYRNPNTITIRLCGNAGTKS